MPSDVWNSDDVRKVLINPMYLQHRNWYSMDEHLQGACVTAKLCVLGAAAAKLPCCAKAIATV